jgi:hypothetical protein
LLVLFIPAVCDLPEDIIDQLSATIVLGLNTATGLLLLAVVVVPAVTKTGLLRSALLPVASVPKPFEPHMKREPFDRIAPE